MTTEYDIFSQALSRVGDYRIDLAAAQVVSSATAANPVVVTSTAHGRVDGDVVLISAFAQMTQVNDRVFRVASPTANTYQLKGENGLAYIAETTGGLSERLEPSKETNLLYQVWPRVRAAAQRAHDWKCLLRYDRLARLGAPKTVTGATKANPVVITTSAAHGFVAGGWVRLASVGGMVEISERWFTVGTAPTTTTFTLAGENGTAYTTYTSGGTATPALTPLRPDFGFEARYDLPADYVRMIAQPQDDPDQTAWSVVGREVYSDAAPVVPILYVRRVLAPSAWDELFITYTAALLASEIVENLTQSNSKKEGLLRDMQLALRQARGVSELEEGILEPEPTSWELARD